MADDGKKKLLTDIREYTFDKQLGRFSPPEYWNITELRTLIDKYDTGYKLLSTPTGKKIITLLREILEKTKELHEYEKNIEMAEGGPRDKFKLSIDIFNARSKDVRKQIRLLKSLFAEDPVLTEKLAPVEEAPEPEPEPEAVTAPTEEETAVEEAPKRTRSLMKRLSAPFVKPFSSPKKADAIATTPVEAEEEAVAAPSAEEEADTLQDGGLKIHKNSRKYKKSKKRKSGKKSRKHKKRRTRKHKKRRTRRC